MGSAGQGPLVSETTVFEIPVANLETNQPTEMEDQESQANPTLETASPSQIRMRGFVVFMVGVLWTGFMFYPYFAARNHAPTFHVWPGLIMLSIAFLEVGFLDLVLGKPFQFKDTKTGKLTIVGKTVVAFFVITGLGGYVYLEFLWWQMGYTGGYFDILFENIAPHSR